MAKKVDAISMTDLNHISIFILMFFGISMTIRVIYNSLKPLLTEKHVSAAGTFSKLDLNNVSSIEGFGNQSGLSVSQYVHSPHTRRGVAHGHNSVNLDDDDTSNDDDDGQYNETDSDDTSDDNSESEFPLPRNAPGSAIEDESDDDDSDTDSDDEYDEELKEKKREYREKRRSERNSFMAKYDRMVSHKLTEILGTPEEREKTKGDLKRLALLGVDNLKRRISHLGLGDSVPQ